MKFRKRSRHWLAPTMIGATLLLTGLPSGPGASAWAQDEAGGSIKVTKAKPADSGAYDFERVVTQVREKVTPLQQHMKEARTQVVSKMNDAVTLLDQDQLQPAISKSIEAMDAMTSQKDGVQRSLYQAQEFLVKELGNVKLRLAKNLAESGKQKGKFDPNSEKILKDLAAKIKSEKNPERKKRLRAQFDKLYFMAETKAMTVRLPEKEQQKWRQILVLLQKSNERLAYINSKTELMFQRVERMKIQLDRLAKMGETADGLREMVSLFDDLANTVSGEDNAALESMLQEVTAMTDLVDTKISGDLDELEAEIAARSDAAEAEMASPDLYGDDYGSTFNESQDYLDELMGDSE